MKSIDEVMMELTPIFRDALDDERLILKANMSARNVEGWDSFTHMQLIAAIERQFEIHFRLKELLNFRDVGDMCRAILRLMQ